MKKLLMLAVLFLGVISFSLSDAATRALIENAAVDSTAPPAEDSHIFVQYEDGSVDIIIIELEDVIII